MILVRMKQMTALSAPQIPGWHKSVHHTRKYLWVCVYLSVYLTMFLSNDVDIALSRNGVIYIYIIYPHYMARSQGKGFLTINFLE